MSTSQEPDSSSGADPAAEEQTAETTAATSEQPEKDATHPGEAEKAGESGEGNGEGDAGDEAEAEAKVDANAEAKAAEPEERDAPAEPDQQQQQPSEEECNGKASTTETAEEAAPTSPEEKASPLQEKIIRQVEFYFGDRNFPKDKFLQQSVESSPGGWVPLTTLLTFNRLKALSSDAEVIACALRKSRNGIVQVNEDGKSVRRNPDKAVPDIFDVEFRKGMMDRTVYAKGFPEDTQLDQIQEFMDQYGKIHCIQMRRMRLADSDKKFKGSIFVEFVSVEDAEKFVKSEKVQFNGNDLLIEWKSDYFKRKDEERKQKKEEMRSAKRAPEEKKKTDGPTQTKSAVRVSGAILHFKGLEGDKSREDLKEELLEFATVAFVDFDHGNAEGYVRFREEGGADKAREGLLGRAVGGSGVAQLCGSEVELRVLEGEEEEEYWHKVGDGSKAKDKRGGGGGGGRRGGRGRGRGWGRRNVKRDRSTGGGRDEHTPECKVQKTSEE